MEEVVKIMPSVIYTSRAVPLKYIIIIVEFSHWAKSSQVFGVRKIRVLLSLGLHMVTILSLKQSILDFTDHHWELHFCDSVLGVGCQEEQVYELRPVQWMDSSCVGNADQHTRTGTTSTPQLLIYQYERVNPYFINDKFLGHDGNRTRDTLITRQTRYLPIDL
ncbi:unnamed protein product, partial [Timema podura]|nr:unnamed protein product [Timema podura]